MNRPKMMMAVVAMGTIAGMLTAFGNGTETLGPANLSLQTGSHMVAAGTGLYTQPGTIHLSVPAGASVKQVLLYWDGHNYAAGTTQDNIQVNGTSVTGVLIGGPSLDYASFRSDITSKNWIKPGANVLTVSGSDNGVILDGAGVLAIIDDGSGPAQLDIRDGLDWAYWKYSGALQVTQPQPFTFLPASEDRVGALTLFVGSVDQNRPNQIKLTVNGQTTTLVDKLFSNEGDQWDTLALAVAIPAGATSLTAELVSTPVDNALGGGASLVWLTAAFSLENPPSPAGPGTRTQGFWKNHPAAWPDGSIVLGGHTYSKAEAIAIMDQPGRGDKTLNLAEQLIAAKLNVAVGNESSCVEQAISAADVFLIAHPIGSDVSASSAAWKSIESAFGNLGAYNEGQLCAAHTDSNGDSGPAEPQGHHGFTKIEKHGKELLLNWSSGQLECADDFNGPWTAVSAPSGSVALPLNAPKKFYRLKP